MDESEQSSRREAGDPVGCCLARAGVTARARGTAHDELRVSSARLPLALSPSKAAATR